MTPVTSTQTRARPTLADGVHQHEFRPAWTLTAFALLAAGIALAIRDHQSLWLVAAGIIGPDLSFVAAIGARPLTPGLLAQRAVRPYNIVHTPLTPTLVLGAGLAPNAAVTTIAIAWLSHIAWDRGLGYRLRDPDGSIRSHRRHTQPQSHRALAGHRGHRRTTGPSRS
jgi:hypothetical protein